MIIDVITIFPEMFSPVLGESIIKRAQDKGLVKINLHDLRDYSDDAHRKVDAASYGGGGMVFKVEPFFKALKSVLGKQVSTQANLPKPAKVILFGPAGKKLTQPLVKRLLKQERLVLLAPRYEGVDERVREHLIDEEISIGDFVLSGAELAAMVLIDCLVRLVPGVVSNRRSVKEESFENSRLDFPHYTKPPEFNGWKVPEVLLSGDHAKIKQWRKKQALEMTKEKRPDLLRP
ncbi:MAG: tRNA (guanosine(37)-N1)-methyltransferase TrmD [Candidatus Omnitrophota bacterium]|jgi:tRNA (guanine37-N1)-methyltransferase